MAQKAIFAKVNALYNLAVRLILQRLMVVDVTFFACVDLVCELCHKNEDLQGYGAHGCRFFELLILLILFRDELLMTVLPVIPWFSQVAEEFLENRIVGKQVYIALLVV